MTVFKLSRAISLSEIAAQLKIGVVAWEAGTKNVEANYITNHTSSSTEKTLLVLEPGAEKYFSTEVKAAGIITFADLPFESDLPILQLKDSVDNHQRLLQVIFPAAKNTQHPLIGITGTNGKTSVNWLLFHALEAAGIPAQRIGTLGYANNQEDHKLDNTTPAKFMGYAYLQKANQEQIAVTVMEVSSHGLSLGRVDGLNFSVGIYTNLSRDHFDFYKNFESYYQAKKLLFSKLAESQSEKKFAIINLDDKYGSRLIQELGMEVEYPILSYSVNSLADVQILESQQGLSSARYCFRIKGQEIQFESKLLGKFNEDNFAACIACLHYYFEISLAKIPEILTGLPPVPGRLEPYQVDGKAVLIDYAHTPDALKNVLTSVKRLPHGKLWVVFGCGGDRDPGKRAEMGKICSQLADKVVVTSDNPRSEDPNQIMQDILVDCVAEIVEVDRARAIQQAIAAAAPEDIIIIAGKGHEDYQEIKGQFLPYSDAGVLRDLIK